MTRAIKTNRKYTNDLLNNLKNYQTIYKIKSSVIYKELGVSKSYFNKIRTGKIRITYDYGKNLEEIIQDPNLDLKQYKSL